MLLKLLKQAFDKPPAAPQAAPAAPPAAPGEPPLEALIDYCSSLAHEALLPDTEATLGERSARFDALAVPPAPLHVFVYHVDMGDAGKLQYRDIAVDTSRFDYQAVLRAFADSVARWEPDANVFVVTRPDSPLAALRGGRVQVLELDLAADRPMYERVGAMCAYVHSGAFAADTLFLDSDAFLNAPAQPWLLGEFDIGVTYRDSPGLMPVNEGVLAAKAARADRVRQFFRRYLATYDTLRGDERIQGYYGDIRKWRGGQLSLNAITRGVHPYCAFRDIASEGVVLRALPCDPYNYSYAYGSSFDGRELASKAVVHFKGLRKDALDAWLRHVGGGAAAVPGTAPAQPAVAGGAGVLEWAARNCLALEGDFVQVGGMPDTLVAMQRACGAAAPTRGWKLLQRFDERGLPQRLAFAYLELGAVAAPQDCLRAVTARLAPGGVGVIGGFASPQVQAAAAACGIDACAVADGRALWIQR